MDCDEMEALRNLIDFASDHAGDVYEGDEWQESYDDLMESVKIATAYLDGDQNETEDETL